jgi:hypothetical protein
MPLDDTTRHEPDGIGRLLLRAADVIREFGWVQNSFGNKRVGFCLIGAIGFAAWGAWRPEPDVSNQYDQAAVRLGHFLCGDPVYYNDDPMRTKEDVIAALEAAAYKGYIHAV